jgi:hypothetical protein
MNWGEINNFAQIVGYSETSVPNPNGETFVASAHTSRVARFFGNSST